MIRPVDLIECLNEHLKERKQAPIKEGQLVNFIRNRLAFKPDGSTYEPPRRRLDRAIFDKHPKQSSMTPLKQYHYIRCFFRACVFYSGELRFVPDDFYEEFEDYFGSSALGLCSRIFSVRTKGPLGSLLIPGIIEATMSFFDSTKGVFGASLLNLLRAIDDPQINRLYAEQGFFGASIGKGLVYSDRRNFAAPAFRSDTRDNPGIVQLYKNITLEACDPFLASPQGSRPTSVARKEARLRMRLNHLESLLVFRDAELTSQKAYSAELLQAQLEALKSGYPVEIPCFRHTLIAEMP